MNVLKNWIQAFRPQSLPLSLSGIIMGSSIAFIQYQFSWIVFVFALLTAIGLQILSNLANDYGDFIKGTDTFANRNDRALASGNITLSEMKNAIVFAIIFVLLCGILLLLASNISFNFNFIMMFLIGIIAIIAAITYTVGKNAYGYIGLGDIFVLIFFGIVSVGGSYFLLSNEWPITILHPSICIGLLSVGVLNINNMRDIEKDKACNKTTIAVRLGFKYAKMYHLGLIIIAFLCMFYFAYNTLNIWDEWLSILCFGLFMFLAFEIKSKMTILQFNLSLKKHAILTLAFSLAYAMVLILL